MVPLEEGTQIRLGLILGIVIMQRFPPEQQLILQWWRRAPGDVREAIILRVKQDGWVGCYNAPCEQICPMIQHMWQVLTTPAPRLT